jgi:hypothetical protein
MNQNNKIINAEAVLFSPTGKSILDKMATADNLQELLPSEKAKVVSVTILKKNGFSVNVSGPSLSITGKKSLFEKVFKFSVGLKTVNKETYPVALTKPSIPPELKSFVKTIVFSEPMEYFG